MSYLVWKSLGKDGPEGPFLGHPTPEHNARKLLYVIVIKQVLTHSPDGKDVLKSRHCEPIKCTVVFHICIFLCVMCDEELY
jgi:hypothetical protein